MSFMRGVLAVVLAVVLAGCAADSGAFFNAAALKDGTLPDKGQLTSGLGYTVTHSGKTGFEVHDGRLTADVTLAYLNLDAVRGPIRQFSIETSWSDNGKADDELAAIIVADGPFANNYPSSYANAGAHVLVFRDRWVMQKRTGAGPPVSLATNYYPAPLAYGLQHRLAVLWDGRSATIVGPSGERTSIPYDADVADWWGPYACAEIVGSTEKNKVGIHAFNLES